jgi:hypothetical protein
VTENLHPFARAIERTRVVVNAISDGNERAQRIALLGAIIQALAHEQEELPEEEAPNGLYRAPLDIIVLNERCARRCWAADLRIVILVGALKHPDVLTYVNDEFPCMINEAPGLETIREEILRWSGLVGLWELEWLNKTAPRLQLITPDSLHKPVQGTLLYR